MSLWVALVVFATASAVAAPGSNDDALVIVDDDNPVDDAPASPPCAPVLPLRFDLRNRLLVNTHIPAPDVDSLSVWSLARFRLDHPIDATVSARVEAWVRWGVRLRGQPMDPRWAGEVELREGYVTWKRAALTLRLGQRVFAWGKNELMAPADVLNPVDLRHDPTLALDSPKDAKVPIFAAEGTYRSDAGLETALVLMPFFTPQRGFMVGHDFALLPRGSPYDGIISRAFSGLNPAAQDRVQQGFVGTHLPADSPLGMAAALRISDKVRDWDVAATFYYGWDRTPHVVVDRDLITLLGAAARIAADPTVAVLDPDVSAARVGVAQKQALGQSLGRVSYQRLAVVALEAEGIIGPFVTRLDVGVTPAQTFYTHAYTPVSLPTTRAVAGAEYLRGDRWFASINAYSTVAFAPPHDTLLLGLESGGASTQRQVALLYGVLANARWMWPDGGGSVSAGGAYNIAPGDYAGWTQLAYTPWESHAFAVGAFLVRGPQGSVGFMLERSTLAYLQYHGSW